MRSAHPVKLLMLATVCKWGVTRSIVRSSAHFQSKLMPDLSPREERSCLLARTLWREGYNDHLAGAISLTSTWGVDTFVVATREHLLWIRVPCAPRRDSYRPRGTNYCPRRRFGRYRSGIPLHLALHKLRPGSAQLGSMPNHSPTSSATVLGRTWEQSSPRQWIRVQYSGCAGDLVDCVDE
jgi:hypothetical protein